MAFSKRSLIRLTAQLAVGNAAGNPTTPQIGLLMYGTDDAAAVVEAASYFDNARLQLNKGDIIIASMVNAGVPVMKQYVVTAAPKTTGAVTITLQTVTAG